MMLLNELLESLKDCTSKDDLLMTVKDEDGNTVHIILQTCWDKSGEIVDKSVMAVNESGTLYPEWSSKAVLTAIRESVKRIHGGRGV